MKRVMVVGSGGAGKTAFSRRLGAILGLPVIHLDEHYWHPGWVETPREEWRDIQRRLTSGDAWIVDGNYGGTAEVRIARCDTVVLLDFPRLVCARRALWRSLRNRGRAVQAPGCPERFDWRFLQWIWCYPVEGRQRMLAKIGRHADDVELIRLRSPSEAERFLGALDTVA